MKEYRQGSEEAKTKKVLDEISDEMDLEDDASKRARLKRELVEEMHKGVSADGEKIRAYIEDEIVGNSVNYPSLLNIYDGNLPKLADKVRDCMIGWARKFGTPKTVKQMLGEMEGHAARHIYRVGIDESKMVPRVSLGLGHASGSIG